MIAILSSVGILVGLLVSFVSQWFYLILLFPLGMGFVVAGQVPGAAWQFKLTGDNRIVAPELWKVAPNIEGTGLVSRLMAGKGAKSNPPWSATWV